MKGIFQGLTRNYAWLAIILTVILFTVNLILLPSIIAPENIITTLGLLTIFILIAMAATPSILSGGGGIDISVGAIMGIINVGFVTYLPAIGIEGPAMSIITALFIGALLGTINGLLVTV
ncbi:MAG: ABC transporter permease, partial [Clostridiaceae bacterium]|nr:ABC transporter permease [Clostridiaceae bacterium]